MFYPELLVASHETSRCLLCALFASRYNFIESSYQLLDEDRIHQPEPYVDSSSTRQQYMNTAVLMSIRITVQFISSIQIRRLIDGYKYPRFLLQNAFFLQYCTQAEEHQQVLDYHNNTPLPKSTSTTSTTLPKAHFHRLQSNYPSLSRINSTLF